MPGNREQVSVLTEVVRDVLSIPDVELSPDTVAADIDGWDSLAHMLIMHELEKRLGITLPIEQTYEAKNVGELCDLLARLSPMPKD